MPRSKNQPRLLQDESPKYEPQADPLAELHRPLTKEDLDQVRHIEGFPIGSDEDIIALSDPPYYTACPNPFLEDFIRAYGKPYDEATDTYHREPFAADVSEGRYSPENLAHSYHTKVPARAIAKYVLHYTEPGDIIFDGFCGTGMTGVATQICGKPDSEFRTRIESEMPDVTWGKRHAVLSDLSPAASFISYNYNTPSDLRQLRQILGRAIAQVEKEIGWMFKTIHSDGATVGEIKYTVWSDVFTCPECNTEITYWNNGVDPEAEKALDSFECPNCQVLLKKSDLEHLLETYFDPLLSRASQRLRMVPVLINYSVGKKRFNKKPDAADIAVISRIETFKPNISVHTEKLMFKDGAWGDQWRKGYHTGVTHTHHYYTWRNYIALSLFWESIKNDLPSGIGMVLTATGLKLSKLARYMFDAAGRIQNGVLYIPSLYQEMSPFLLWPTAVEYIERFKQFVNLQQGAVAVGCNSLSDVPSLPDASIDYIFTDPPFGANLAYSELNFLWESWLKVYTENKPEAIQSKTQNKTLSDYQEIMERCFREYYRVLKPGRWMTVEFHNSQNRVWNAIQEAIIRAGFVVADVRTLDKEQGSYNAVSAAGAVKRDLVISAYRPLKSFEIRFLQEAGSEQGAWDFIRQHLLQLPIFVSNNDAVEIIAERQNYLLFDRMIAFHIQHGASIPINASEFYTGLRQRFPERDGMYFLPEQVAQYDSQRAQVAKVEQLNLFVTDEKSAMQWLRMQLEQAPQTYSDLVPKFLKELYQARHEQLPELSVILSQNFLQDAAGRWYVPDPSKAGDLEKLREKDLLREFDLYRTSKGKLKTFRTEAVRAGFKDAWSKRDYATIVEIAQRLPEDVLQEDQTLLMFYDNAATRLS